MTDDLIAWLRAQLDSDEQEVRESRMLSEGHWALPGFLNDRNWLLADIDAKRRILDLVPGIQEAEDTARQDYGFDAKAAKRLVRLLAEPYAERPGYREEWRP